MAYFNPFRRPYGLDPYPFLARLRESEPVHRSPDLKAWIVTSYEECSSIIHDTARFSSDPINSTDQRERIAHNRAVSPLGDYPFLANCDPPQHTRLREIVNRAFVPRVVSGMRASIEATVATMLEEAPPDREFDVMRVVAEPLPAFVVFERLGVPAADRAKVREWSTAILRARLGDPDSPGVIPAARQAAEALADYVREFAAREAERDPDCVLSTLVRACESESLPLEQAMLLLIHISMSGNGPTAFLIANAIKAVAERPDIGLRLREHPELLPNAIEEVMRFDSPTHSVSRFCLDERSFGVRTIRPGDTVHIMIGAANRDPARFPEPDAFEIEREGSRHLSFGTGAHYCLGAALGKLEAEVVLGQVLDRWPSLEVNEYEPGGTLALRGPARLVVSG